MTVEIETIDGDAADLVREVEAALDEAARALGKPFADDGINLRASDGDGGFIGGLSGQILQRWLYVRLLAVAPQARALGVGRKLMAGAEEEARKRGLVGVYLDTYDFQAPGFYEKLGYSEFGRLPAAGGAPQRIYFAKPFRAEGP